MDIFTTSYLRANVIAWIPITKTDRVCYIGQEQDIVAARLRKMAGEVICVLPEHYAGWERQEDKFDHLVCIGSLAALACDFGERADITSVLISLKNHLKENGRLILAVENTFGLKYFAGVKEEGTHEYFGAIEGKETSAGYSKEELQRAVKDAGFFHADYYYPFPDYHFSMSIYSDDYLPKQGELIDQIGNFEEERLILFDEAKAADLLISEGKFPEFSNSYLLIAGMGKEAEICNENREKISYVKFSNDRGKTHNIRTYITQSEDGRKHLIKSAEGAEAEGQIENMKKTYQALQELYADTRFAVNAYIEREKGMELEFLQGHTMEEELDLMLEAGETEAVSEKLLEVFSQMRSCKQMSPFVMTEAFQEVFGTPDLEEGLLAAPVSDIDMIMQNILIQEHSDSWILIDYEWSFHFPVPMNFIIYRAIHYYVETTAKRRVLESCNLYQRAGISEYEKTVYAQMEESFQSYVLAGHKPMRQLYKEVGKPAYHISSVLNVVDEMERRRALQIYFDRGNGFSEADTLDYHSKALDGTYRLEVPVSEDVVKLRIDPGSQACTVDIKQLTWKHNKETVVEFISNGHRLCGSMYLFDTEDPNLLLESLPKENRTLLIDLRIDAMSLAAAEWIAPKIDTKYKIKKMLKK